MEGVSGGVVTIGELKENGDFGLGAFSGLDGRRSPSAGPLSGAQQRGVVRKPGNEALVPFCGGHLFEEADITSIDGVARATNDVAAQLDAHRREPDDLFFAVPRADAHALRQRDAGRDATGGSSGASRRYSTSPTCPAP